MAPEPESQVSVTVPFPLSVKPTLAAVAPVWMAVITFAVKSASMAVPRPPAPSPPTVTVTEAVLVPLSASPESVIWN